MAPPALVLSEAVGRSTRGDAALVPGLGVAAYLWPTAQAIAERGWRVSLLRPPGWPANTQQGRHCTMRDLGAAVAGWLASRPGPIVLVGQSIGTQIAAHAAAQQPGRVRALLLQGPTVDTAYRTTARIIARWMRDAPHQPLSLSRTQFAEWAHVGPPRLIGLLHECLRDDLANTLALVDDSIPVRVVRGEADPLCREKWAGMLTNAPVVAMPGGHAAAAAHPQLFAQLFTGLVEDTP